MNGCSGEGNLLSRNKYCPELGLQGVITLETKLWYLSVVCLCDLVRVCRWMQQCSSLLVSVNDFSIARSNANLFCRW